MLYNFTVMLGGSSDVVPSGKYGSDVVPSPSDMRSTVVVPCDTYGSDVVRVPSNTYCTDVAPCDKCSAGDVGSDDDDGGDGDDFFVAEPCAYPDAEFGASAHV